MDFFCTFYRWVINCICKLLSGYDGIDKYERRHPPGNIRIFPVAALLSCWKSLYKVHFFRNPFGGLWVVFFAFYDCDLFCFRYVFWILSRLGHGALAVGSSKFIDKYFSSLRFCDDRRWRNLARNEMEGSRGLQSSHCESATKGESKIVLWHQKAK